MYERGLEVDDLAEDLYQRLIRTYLQRGRCAEALAVYRRCCEALRRGLAIEPSREIAELAQLLSARGTAETHRTVRGQTGMADARGSDSPPHDGRVAVAFLPCSSPREDDAAGELADGLAEDLMTDLARISLLAVVGQKVVVAYNRREDALSVVTQVSDVPYALTGSVRRVDERL